MFNSSRRPPESWVDVVRGFFLAPVGSLLIMAAVYAGGLLAGQWAIDADLSGWVADVLPFVAGVVVVATATELVFGVPAFLLLLWRGWLSPVPVVAAAALVGGLPILLLAGADFVEQLRNGRFEIASWRSIRDWGLAFALFASCGAGGGAVFWLTAFSPAERRFS